MSELQRTSGEGLFWRISLVVVGILLGLLAPAFGIDQPIRTCIAVPVGLGFVAGGLIGRFRARLLDHKREATP